MHMENINQRPQFGEQPKTQEEIKQETFNDVLRSMMYRFSMEGSHASHFEAVGRVFPITNIAGAVLSLAQNRRAAAEGVYGQVSSH